MMSFAFRPGFWRGAFVGLVLTSSAVAARTFDFFVSSTYDGSDLIGSKVDKTSGIFRHDPANGWVHLPPSDGSLTSVAFDPRDHQVIYTAGGNGCWRSLDGGSTWQLNTGWEMTEGRDVVVDPNAPDHIYLALVSGIAVSTDRGQTWTRAENGLPSRGKFTQTIAVDRTRKGRVIAGCETGIYLTQDGAKRWKRVLATRGTVNTVQQSWHDPKVWVAVTQEDGAWASQDSGNSWKQFPTVPTSHALYNITLDPTHPQRLAIGGWGHGVLVTEDGGKSWQKRNAGLPELHRVWRVGIEPETGQLFANVAREALFVSDDFGRTWKRSAFEGSRINAFITVPTAGTSKVGVK
ncbi:MAG TPA: hypothetical protein PLN52_17305 [Opitutaceae bacterium]|nr:hypothetical protein [Opitutaceae bacterium]